MEIPYIFNIQKFSVHDGPGIRTTVFFKGCPINCLWCHNPESQNYNSEEMKNADGKIEIIGKQYSIKELVKKLSKDQIFYDQSGGGVTLSGGEVMTQNIDYIEKLIKELNRIGISVAIDTSGIGPTENFEKIIAYTDIFLYDIKFLDNELHKKYTGSSNEQVLKNLLYLNEKNANINLRLIILKNINDNEEYINELIIFLKENNINIKNINLLPYHDFGRDKYIRLNRDCTQNFEKPEEEVLENLKEILEKNNYKVSIGG